MLRHQIGMEILRPRFLAQVFGAAGFASVRGTRNVRLPNPSNLQPGIVLFRNFC